MEQLEFISRGEKKIKVEDIVTQILPRNQIQHTAWTPCLKLGISAKARVHVITRCCAREKREIQKVQMLLNSSTRQEIQLLKNTHNSFGFVWENWVTV